MEHTAHEIPAVGFSTPESQSNQRTPNGNFSLPTYIVLLLCAFLSGMISGYFLGVSRSTANKTTTQDIKSLIPTKSVLPTEALSPTDIPSPTIASPSSIILSKSITNSAAMIGSCRIFPADNPWNQDISKLSVHPLSDQYISSIGTSKGLHPDFGGASSGNSWGIPFTTVTSSQTLVPITFTAYGSQSDPGPYPIPLGAAIEGGVNSDGDRHVIVVNTDTCILYELYRGFPTATGWNADSGAVFNLTSNKLRPESWTSADAAGLPIFPGLVKYDEVYKGSINHAIRFTTVNTQRAYIHPATHYASTKTDANLPPMGLRVRLKADYDISKLPAQAKVIATAMKKYGMILADNGGDWFFQGDVNKNWNDEDINTLKTIPGSAFEAVQTGDLIK